MKKMLFLFIILTMVGCATGPKLITNHVALDPIIELERSLAQTEMAIAVEDMRYMLWLWSIQRGDTVYSDSERAAIELRIKNFKETESLIANEIKRRTKEH
jgi:hypothetical protein